MKNSPSKFNHNYGKQNKRPLHDNQHNNTDFLFNKTSLLSSALQKLRKTSKSSAPKRIN